MKTGKPHTNDSTKCIRDLREVPPQTYAMEKKDGRKGNWLRVRRAELVLRLSTYAAADGSSIRVGTDALSLQMDLSRRTVTYLLEDLVTLGFLENLGRDDFYKTRIRRLNVAAILRAAAAAPSPDDDPHAQDSGNHMRKIADPHAQNSGVHVQNSASHAQDSKPYAQDSTSRAQDTYCAQPTSSPTNQPASAPALPPSGCGAARHGLAAASSSQSFTAEEEKLWEEMRNHNDFPEKMITAIPRKDEKRRVIEQLKKYGVEVFVQAIYTWAEDRDKGLDGLVARWRAWLEEGEPLLRREAENA